MRERAHLPRMRKLSLAFLLLFLAVTASAESKVRNVAIFLYNNAEVLDWTGPAEVLAAAGHIAGTHDAPALKVFTVAVTKDPLLTQGFIKVTPEYSIADSPKIDVLVIPGGNTGPTQQNAEAMEWLRKTIEASEITLTVCTGAAPVAKLGFLDGLEITTWYNAIDRLQASAPKTHVKRGRRFIDNGKYITTAGVSAGIDGALHLVGRVLGRRVAEQTAQYMEYHWSPEAYLANSYPLLNPSADERGRTAQLAEIHAEGKNWDSAAAEYQKLIQTDPADTRSLYSLARVYAQQQKNEQAAALLAKAVDAGFKNRDALLNDPVLAGVREQAKVLAAKIAAP
jgi:transcriptional regulator GlxA family with amidase domain